MFNIIEFKELLDLIPQEFLKITNEQFIRVLELYVEATKEELSEEALGEILGAIEGGEETSNEEAE